MVNEKLVSDECLICNNYGQTLDSRYSEFQLMGYGGKEFSISAETCNIEDKFIFNFCPECGRKLEVK